GTGGTKPAGMPAQRRSYVSRVPARLPRSTTASPRRNSRPTMRTSALSLLCVSLLALAAGGCRDAAPPPRHVADIVLPEDGRRVEGTVGPGDTFAHILDRHQVAAADRQAILDVVERAFSSRQLRAHHPYSLTLSPDFRVRELT